MKKTGITALILAGIALIGGAGLYAGRQLARGRAMGEENAVIFACADAGVAAKDAEVRSAALGREDGRSVYLLEFEADGAVYACTVDALDGTVLRSERTALPGSEAAAAQTASAPEQPESASGQTAEPTPSRPASELAAEAKEYAETLPKQADEDGAKAFLRSVLGLTELDAQVFPEGFGNDFGNRQYTFGVYRLGEWYASYDVDPQKETVEEKDRKSWDMNVHLNWRSRVFYEQVKANQGRVEEARQTVMDAVAARKGDGIKQEEARYLAQVYFGLEPQNSYLSKIEQEGSGQDSVWTVELRDTDGNEYSCVIRGSDGWVSESGASSRLATAEELTHGFFYTATEDEAKLLATSSVGTRPEQVTFDKVEKTVENGRTFYEIAFTQTEASRGRKTDCLVDAELLTVTDLSGRGKTAQEMAQVGSMKILEQMISREDALDLALEESGYTVEELTGCWVRQQSGSADFDVALFVRGKGWFECYVSRYKGTLSFVRDEPWDAEAEKTEQLFPSIVFSDLMRSAQEGCHAQIADMQQKVGGYAPMVTLEQAKVVLLTRDLLTADRVTFTKAMYGTEDGVAGYRIALTEGGYESEVWVRASDGQIMRGSGRVKPDHSAWDAALADAGVTEADLLLRDADVKLENGRWLYVFGFRTKNGTQYRYEIDVLTGETLKREAA